MSFRSEVRGFIAEQKTKDFMIKILLGELANLRKHNNDLMDRLMATNFQELKVYSEDEGLHHPFMTCREPIPEDDDQDAGDII